MRKRARNKSSKRIAQHLRRRKLQSEQLEPRRVLSADLAGAADAYWQDHDVIPASTGGAISYLNLRDFDAFSIEVDQLRSTLAAAPLEFTAAAEQPLELAIPAPGGGAERFAVVESPVMAPELAAEFPEIKTYFGYSLENAGSTVRFDVTPQGFHAQVRTSDGQDGYYVDPYYHLENEYHVSYYRSDVVPRDMPFTETVVDPSGEVIFQDDVSDADGYHTHADGTLHSHADHSHSQGAAIPVAAELDTPTTTQDGGDDTGVVQRSPRTGTELRTYRTAIAATGEYTQFHGGSVASGQAAIVTMMNRLNGVYEDELTVRMELVANNTNIVFTSPASDPFSSNVSLTQIQNAVDANIGSANYDLGHLVDTGGGGFAAFGVIGLNGQKARGYTGLTPPVNDPFWIDFVAHEMGHQYGGSHTFNGDSGNCAGGNRTGTSAYEPGSGSTIMAYAGICGNDNLQSHSDDYFHSRSLDQIIGLLDGPRSGVGTRTATGNSVPTADAGLSYTIPASTPFDLTGVGTDADGDTITYNWEQRDLGPQQDVNSGDNGSSPIFRSWTPTTNPTRTLPRLQDLVNNTTVRGETLPTTNRVLDFRLTVRDNRPAGGGVATDNMQATVTTAAGPFLVQVPDTGSEVWEWNQTKNVSWDVAGTNANGVNTSQVDILLSTDGGLTYPTALATNTPNDGGQDVVVPSGLATSNARVRVEAVGNIFFDISNQNFTIQEPSDVVAPTASATAPDVTTAGGTNQLITATYTDDVAIDTSTLGSFNVEVVDPNSNVIATFLVTTPPPNAPIVIVSYTMTPPGGTWDAADNGTYDIRVVAGEVADTNGNPVAAGSIGTFDVIIEGLVIDGDFDDDGDLDCDDINALTTEIADGTNGASFDLTGDGFVDAADLDEWVLNEKGTLYGDANLDFVVETSDFTIWNNNKFTFGTAWCTGDFSADGTTDTTDFNIWNQNKFQSAMLVAPPTEIESAENGDVTKAANVGLQLRQPPRAVATELAVPSYEAQQYVDASLGHDADDAEEEDDRAFDAVDATFADVARWL